jgi:hypothetical protein
VQLSFFLSLLVLYPTMSLNWADATEDTPLNALAQTAAGATAPQIAAAAAAPAGAAPAAATAAQPAPVAAASPPPAAASASAAAASPPPAANGGAQVDGVAAALGKTSLAVEGSDKEDPTVQVTAFAGLHPNDKTAEVSVTLAPDDAAALAAASGGAGGSAPSIYNAVTTFEALGLSQELLRGIYAMGFTAPSKIQAQALPIILAPHHPNLIGQAHHGSGKCWAPGTLMRMHDGSAARVEDVKAGQQLRGDDGTPRTVQPGSVIRGEGAMFAVRPACKERQEWRCNEDHILVLAISAEPRVAQTQTGAFALQRVQIRAGSSPESQVPVRTTVAEVPSAAELDLSVQAEAEAAAAPLVFETTVRDFRALSSELQAECRMFAAAEEQQVPAKELPGYKDELARGWSFAVDPVGEGVYHGFTLDGNGRCLLADGTVTHNTATFSLGVLSRVDLNKPFTQAVILCPTRELAIQVADVLRSLAAFTKISIATAVPVQDRTAPKEKITAQVVVGTPGTVDSKIAQRLLDVRNVVLFVADEADQMIAQEGLGEKTVQIARRLPGRGQTQILLFSATFDEVTRKFSKVVAPNAVEIMVKTEELSLDGIKQYFFDCANEQDKYKTLTDIFSLLEIGQSIIFVHVSGNLCIAKRDGHFVGLIRGRSFGY